MANEFARSLRKYPTNAERKLWARLRQKQFGGFRFRRQQPIGPYVADFFCARAKLIVELDGGQHGKDSHAIRDEVRTRWLDSQGYRVLRFWNNEVIQNLNGVLEGIEIALGAAPHPSRNCGSTSPSRGGGILKPLFLRRALLWQRLAAHSHHRGPQTPGLFQDGVYHPSSARSWDQEG